MIEEYTFGRIVVDGRTYTSDVILYPRRVDDRWWRRTGHSLVPEDLAEIIAERPDVLIVGTGYSGLMQVPRTTRDHLKSLGIKVEVMRTKAACDRYNELRDTGVVIAALHLTC